MELQQTKTDFINVIENHNNVMLDFYADWCGPCQTLMPTVNQLAEELKDQVAIKKVNVDEQQELAAKFGIRSIPTLIFFKNGKAIENHTGLITERDLRQKLDNLVQHN